MRSLYLSYILLALFIGSAGSVHAQCTNLFFSEYIEGSSNNKLIEIYNPTASAVDLSGYQVDAFNNGDTVATNTLNWPAGTMLGSGEVYVIANPSSDSLLLLEADTTSTVTFYNGDDALVLTDTINDVQLDIIGVVGERPSPAWTVGSGSTQNNTLVRKSSVNDGQTDWSISVLGWDVYPINFADSLGSHSINSCDPVSNAVASFQLSSKSGPEALHGADTAWVTLSEIDGDYDITVSLLAGSAASSVDFDLVNGSGLYSITAGQDLLAIPFVIYDDMDDEGNESFTIQISNPAGDVTIGNDEFTFTILDDDTPPTPACTQPFFSEYIEGSSSNKVLEIYNPTGAAIDLGNYRINRYNNGNDGSEDTSGIFNWPAGEMLAPGDVYIIANPGADSIFLTLDDTTSSITFYNGDDVLELEEISSNTVVDAIGEKGVDPGSSWPVGTGATSNSTLVRLPGVNGGQTNWYLGAATWHVEPINFSDSLGAHYMTPCGEEEVCDTVNFVITADVTDETVEGAEDGTIDITVSGGFPPYTFEWSNGDTTEDLSGLADDSYTVMITDSAGCSGTAVFTVMPGPGPCDGVTITVTGTATDETIAGANDGSIDISVSGGTEPYSYDWSNGAMTEDISSLEPDTYSVTVTDSSGCTGTNTFTVNAGADPCTGVTIQITVDKTDESAAGAGDGSIDLTVSGGTAPYSFDWSNGATTEDLTGLDPDTYTVTVTDNLGCTASAVIPIAAGPTAVNEIASLKIFNVYPNPAQGKFQVELQFSNSEDVRLEVTDIAGRIVYDSHAGIVRSGIYPIDNNWPAGLYLLKIIAGDNIAVEPVMIH